MPHPGEVDHRLQAHLRSWLGAWPPERQLHVVGSDRRVVPGWDGEVRVVNGVATPDGAVLSVPPDAVDEVRAAGHDLATVGPKLPAILDQPRTIFGNGVFRWSTDPTPGNDPGQWVPVDDPRVPDWLRPFNGDVLIGIEGDELVAGVGRKMHDDHGHELAVVTEDAHRGRGWATSLVTQAARRVLDEGAVPVYLHAPHNQASARTAVAAGFPDVGWRIVGLFGGADQSGGRPAGDG